jgi:hypothetical protein
MAVVGTTSLGTGATFAFKSAAPLLAIEVTSISLDGPEAIVADSSHLGTATGLHSKIKGELLDPGTMTVEGYLDGSIDPDGVVGQTENIVVVSGSTTIWTWTTAICTSFSFNIPLEDVETCTATFKLTGALALT